MKPVIAQAAMTLLVEKNVSKLTVKDIIDECGISRQTFYYHFAGIPELFEWSFQQQEAEMLRACGQIPDPEEQLRFFFQTAVQALPYIRKGMASNYGAEIERLLFHQIGDLLRFLVQQDPSFQGFGPAEQDRILRYHAQAVMGILRSWTRQDTENLDDIVHTVWTVVQKSLR